MDTLINSIIHNYDDYKKDNYDKSDIISLLRWIDTIHDFNDPARGEDISSILNIRFKQNVKDFLSTISKSLSKDTTITTTITPSAVEVTTELFYQKVFGIKKVGKKPIDIKQIVESYGKENPEVMPKDILKQLGIDDTSDEANIQLSLTERKFFKDNRPGTNFLANFILTFFGKDFIGSDDNEIYFLVDASVGKLDCIFQEIGQVSTLINVLTIGDSAVTSVSDITSKSESTWCGVADYINPFKKKTYLEGNNALPYNNIPDKRYDIKSNEFTKDRFSIWYQDTNPDKPFSKINNAGARMYVQDLFHKDQEPWFSEFSILESGSPNSGTSVGVLKQLIIIINQDTDKNNKQKAIERVYKYETQFNLSPILNGMLDRNIDKNDIINFLYDYKRAGDHEQVNSANYLYEIQKQNVILLTGDRLCSLYARLINQPCIFIHDGKYDMYRHLSNLTNEEKLLKDINTLNSRIQVIQSEINNLITKKDDISKKLESFKGKIEEILNLSPSEALKFENKLYSFILKKLLDKIERIKDLNSDENDIIIKKKSELEKKNNIKDLNSAYAEFYTEYNELFNFVLYLNENPKKFNNIKQFKSNALDYNNIIVKEISNYFDLFPILPIRESSREKNTQIAIKTNIIQRIGGDEYRKLMDHFVIYIKKCNLYENNDANNYNDNVKHTINELALTMRQEIQLKINERVKSDSFLTQTNLDYDDIFKLIKSFIIENLKIKPLVVEPVIETEPTEIEEIKEIEGITHDITENERLMEINTNIKATIVEKLQNMKNSLYALTNTKIQDTLEYFKNSLYNRIKYEQELFYPSESTLGGGNPTDDNVIHIDGIKNILNHYYYNIQGSHIKLFIDTYISAIDNDDDNDDIIEPTNRTETIKKIYRYVLSIYPGNLYSFLFNPSESFITPSFITPLVVKKTTPDDNYLVKSPPTTQSSDFFTPRKRTLKNKPLEITFNKPPKRTLKRKTKWNTTKWKTKRKTKRNTKNNPLKGENKENISEERKRSRLTETPEKNITIMPASKKQKQPIMRSLFPLAENNENTKITRKRSRSSETPGENIISKKQKPTAMRSLFPLEVFINRGGSKKCNRKYKKYNKIKKTKQNRKKMVKNKTLKKKNKKIKN